jgi:hypothetical protein
MNFLQRFQEAGQSGRDGRPSTLWAWNDRLDPDEVRRQIRQIALGGLGGHFMHANTGLQTPYLGPEWLEAVRAAVEEGGHTGVAPWLFDENGSPSGACGGRVYGGREAFRQKHLAMEEIQPAQWEPSERTIAVFVAEKGPAGELRSFRRLPEPRSVFSHTLGGGEAAVHFFYRTGEYVDVFNREAAEEFLKQTHEAYRASVGGEFGRSVPGLFTEEPQYAGGGHKLPWSLELPRFFRRGRRYELIDHLPELFFPVGQYRKTRFDYYETVTRLFLLAWAMPVYQWCDRNGLALTGHLAGEDTLLGQVTSVGAAMPHYEYMHMPGIDHAGRGLGSPVAAKQAASVAAQLGRTHVLGKLFAGSGWNTRFDDLRWIAEWHFALGINRLCQHHAAYSLRGLRKRDFPPSLHYHQPWWPQYYLWNDYAARVTAVLEQGQAAIDVLVVHPSASAWSEYSPLEHGPVHQLDEQLRALAEFILATHADFHFGDELIMERKGSVSARGELAVGACRYRTVVVPDATNLRRSTVRMLETFRKGGGQIVFAGRVPAFIDGEVSKEVADLARRCVRADISTPRGRAALKKAMAPALEVLDARGKDAATVLAHWRRDGKDNLYFFVNTAPERSVKARIGLPGEGKVIALDATTGEGREVPAKSRSKRTNFTHTFGPRESLLVVQSAETADQVIALPMPEPVRGQKLTGRWNVKRLDPNILVLDTARWRTDEGNYSDAMNVLDIQQELMQRGTQEVIVLRYEFDCGLDDFKGRRFELVVEQPQAYEMWYNGMRTPLADGGAFWDSAWRRIDITPFVRRGQNVIELRRPWHIDERRRALLMGRTPGWESRLLAPDVELEPIFIIGDFGVTFPKGSRAGPQGSRWMQGQPRMVDEPGRLGAGDLVRAGYPFFVGRLMLEREVILRRDPSPDAMIELPPFDAVTATVHVNGDEAGAVWKEPRVLPVGNLLQKGRNRVAITLTTSLRNLLGPHHHPDGELHGVSPQSFACVRGWFGRAAGHRSVLNDYNVVDFSLGGEVILRA